MKSIFCTTASISQDSGGGVVSYHELEALKGVSDVALTLTRNDILPQVYNAFDVPFLSDYFASLKMEGLNVDLAVFNGNPWGLSAKKLKPAKIIADVPAHNLEQSIEEFRRLGLKYNYVHMTDPYLWSCYTEHIRIADVVLCPSKMSAEYITKKLSLTNRVVVIAHGCTLPSETKPLPEIFTVGHVSVNGPDKGQIYLVNAWNSLQLKNARIMLAGYGTEHWGGLGHIGDVRSIYEQSSIYVQPSITEAFGITLLEAMAHGRPAIVTEGCGASELIEDGKEGFVVPIRDVRSIAEKIQFFRDNPSEIGKMGRNARSKAKLYDWKIIESKYVELFKEVVM